MTTTLQLRQVSNILAVLTGHVGFPLHAKLSRHQRVKCSIEPIQLTLKHIFLQQVSGERHLNSGCSMETYSQEYGVQQHSNPIICGYALRSPSGMIMAILPFIY